jgi:hypothetical protein
VTRNFKTRLSEKCRQDWRSGRACALQVWGQKFARATAQKAGRLGYGSIWLVRRLFPRPIFWSERNCSLENLFLNYFLITHNLKPFYSWLIGVLSLFRDLEPGSGACQGQVICQEGALALDVLWLRGRGGFVTCKLWELWLRSGQSAAGTKPHTPAHR